MVPAHRDLSDRHDARIGFRRHLRAVVAPGEATYLLSPQGVTALEGAHIEALAPLLDGSRTVPAVLREGAGRVPPAEAGRLLAQLAKANLVGYRTGAAAGEAEQAYWDLAGLDGAAASTTRAQVPVAVSVLGGAGVAQPAAQVHAACRQAGLTVVDPDRCQPGFSLVVCDDYLDPRLRQVDADHRAAGTPWLLAKPYGFDIWVGPVFGRDGGPCWSCLAYRLREHRRAEHPAMRALGVDGPIPRPETSLPPGRAMGVGMAVLEAAKWLAGLRSERHDAVTVLDTLDLHTTHHPVRRRPQCPDCGRPDLVAEQVRRPVALVSRPKVAHTGGNHRALTPEQVLTRYRDLVGPVTGVVSELQRDARLPAGIPCYLSGQNLAMAAGNLAGMRSGLRSLSGGKGVTEVEAEVSALCEAVERYCGSRQGDEPTIRDTLAGLGGRAIHPNDCQLFAEDQFRDRHRWNATHSALHRVGPPFDPHRPVDWTPVWSVSNQTHRLLPTSMLYYCATGGDEPWADSNGNAAGASLEDAVVQGFLELVERDAVAQWWYNRTRHPAVDLDAFDEPWLAELRATYHRLHREVWALDLTSDLGVPAMASISCRTDKPAQDVTFGFGAHFDPRLALRRAMTEMNQLLAAVVEAKPDGSGYGVSDPEPRSWWANATVANQPYLAPDPAETPRSPAGFGYRPRADLRDDVEAIDALVRAHGLELLVLDQTRPDVGMPVAKVLVPGMRHFWARFAPGRLFDVPVRLGRLGRRTGRDELNPIPLFV